MSITFSKHLVVSCDMEIDFECIYSDEAILSKHQHIKTAIKELRNRGWFIGVKDVCPECNDKIRVKIIEYSIILTLILSLHSGQTSFTPINQPLFLNSLMAVFMCWCLDKIASSEYIHSKSISISQETTKCFENVILIILSNRVRSTTATPQSLIKVFYF